MKDRKELLGYCVLYCGDCAGYSGEIADAAKRLMEMLEKYTFERTAKSMFPEKFRDYEILCDGLGFMISMKCPKICRERDDSDTSCKVRECCIDRGFYACYECDELEACDKLKELHSGLCGDCYLKNSKAIKEMGLEVWITSGKRYWFGSDVENHP